MAENLPEPKSRKEVFLAKAAGEDISTLPTPESREELFLNAIATNGGSGGGSSIKILTSADYDYDPNNTGTNTAIALWRLPAGIYQVNSTTTDVYGGDSPMWHLAGIGDVVWIQFGEAMPATINGVSTTVRPYQFMGFDTDTPNNDGMIVGTIATNGMGIQLHTVSFDS